MKNKTKAQLIEENNELNEMVEKIQKNWYRVFGFMRNAHKKIKYLKRVIKRNAKIKNEYLKSIEFWQTEAKTNNSLVHSELRGQKRINEINEQALISCENANNDLHAVNRYLEMLVSDLTIKLNEVHNENN